jgi:hypothetical protein
LLDEDPASVAVSYQTMIDRIGPKKAQRQLGISLPGGHAPTLVELSDAAREYGWSVITLTPRCGAAHPLTGNDRRLALGLILKAL